MHNLQHTPNDRAKIEINQAAILLDEKSDYAELDSSGQFSSLQIDLGSTSTTLAFILALKLTTNSLIEGQTSGLPFNMMTKIAALLGHSVRHCYKLSFGQKKGIPIRITTKIQLENAIFRREENTKQTDLFANGACFYRNAFYSQPTHSCRNTVALFTGTEFKHVIEPRRILKEITKAISVKKSIFVDGDIEYYVEYEANMGHYTTKGVCKAKAPSSVGVKNGTHGDKVLVFLTHQPLDHCYTHPAKVVLPTTAKPRHFLQLGTVSSRFSLFALFIKMKDSYTFQIEKNYLEDKYSLGSYCHTTPGRYFGNLWGNFWCRDMITCSQLIPGEPELVTWQEAYMFCKARNMTLVTIGSKEEELIAFSLQTVVSKEGRRHDT